MAPLVTPGVYPCRAASPGRRSATVAGPLHSATGAHHPLRDEADLRWHACAKTVPDPRLTPERQALFSQFRFDGPRLRRGGLGVFTGPLIAMFIISVLLGAVAVAADLIF